MGLRLAEVFLPEKGDALVDEIKRQFAIIDSHYSTSEDGGELKLLLKAETAEPVFDFLEKRYGHMAGFRIIVIAETQKDKTNFGTL